MQLNNHLEIYKLLPKTNCKSCGIPTCMAFAVAVFKGQKTLVDCPHLDDAITQKFEVKVEQRISMEEQQDMLLQDLKKKLNQVDFTTSDTRLGGKLVGDKISIKILGKDFNIDPQGNLSSNCHLIPWVTIPLLDYIITSTGAENSGQWVPFRELKSGSIRNPLFVQRCEKPLKQIADQDPELFEDILHIFGGRPLNNSTSDQADIALVLHPLPKVPVLFRYVESSDGAPSQFNVFFDADAENHLSIDSLHMIISGFVIMFEKIMITHN